MPTIARLGVDNIYLGKQTVTSVSAGQVQIPDECDLTPGRYRWDDQAKTFVPLNFAPRDVANMPNVLRALAQTIRSVQSGQPLGPEALAFLQWYHNRFEQP